MCYTCVRECPSKAIRIQDGQAQVIDERCIGCGNCVRNCSQGAKEVVNTVDLVRELLKGPHPAAACIAPSFAAEFDDYGWQHLVGMMKKLGFLWVNEVGFGADLVAKRYRELLEENTGDRYIATSCPAVVTYIERYHPDLVKNLAPIASPMVATARVLRQLHGDDLRVVFIGPCIAKKSEGCDPLIADEVDAVITFAELRQMFAEDEVTPDHVKPTDFDQPRANLGAVFPISRGMLQAAHIQEDLLADEVVAADGRTGFVEALKEFQSGDLNVRLLEILACEGCIMGAGMTTGAPLFTRRTRVARFVRESLAAQDEKEWHAAVEELGDVDLARRYMADDQRVATPVEDELDEILQRMGKQTPEDFLNCGACGYDTCREHAIAIFKGLAETEMCLPNTIEQLRTKMGELADSNENLVNTKQALMQSEKLASMGQLAAGIAHEVNNPLGVVLMYAHLLLEACEDDSQAKEDISLIVEQADRCKKIVAGLLHFARQNKVVREETDIRELVAQSIQTCKIPDTVQVHTQHDDSDPAAEVDGDQIIQVLTNLINNACVAMPEGGQLIINTGSKGHRVFFRVTDTGTGIPEEHRAKIFEPFFTTKPIGKGTGLGLAVTYGIVKMHSGDIRVESNAGEDPGPTGTTFTVSIPREGAMKHNA